MDRLTKRTDKQLSALYDRPAFQLTFNELLALAGEKLNEKLHAANHGMGNTNKNDKLDAIRDFSLSHTHLEDALTRHNSGCYRLNGTWIRPDPEI